MLSGFTLYSQAIIGQTPCYTVLPTNLPSDAASAAVSSISAQIAATASAGSTPTVSVHVITDQVFALSLPHTPRNRHTSVATKIGAGVGAGVGGLLLLLLLSWAFALRRRLRREKDHNRYSAGMAGSGSTPLTVASIHSGSQSRQPSYQPPVPISASGPSPPEMQNQNYSPWAPYVPPSAQQHYQQSYQQPQPGQQWQNSAPNHYQAQPGVPGPPPMTSIPEQYNHNYHELSGVQTDAYETSAQLPRPGVSRMPDGRTYAAPVEMGRSSSGTVLQGNRGGDVSVNF